MPKAHPFVFVLTCQVKSLTQLTRLLKYFELKWNNNSVLDHGAFLHHKHWLNLRAELWLQQDSFCNWTKIFIKSHIYFPSLKWILVTFKPQFWRELSLIYFPDSMPIKSHKSHMIYMIFEDHQNRDLKSHQIICQKYDRNYSLIHEKSTDLRSNHKSYLALSSMKFGAQESQKVKKFQ